MADFENKSEFDDGRSGYDMNDYTQGNYDGVLESGEPSPRKPQPAEGGNAVVDEDEEAATHTDFGDYLDDEDEDVANDGYFD